MSEEIHDTSRLDAFMAARRRAMVLHAVWRPMLAGAAGSALVIAAVWVTLPKISYREIEGAEGDDARRRGAQHSPARRDRGSCGAEGRRDRHPAHHRRTPAEKAFIDSKAYADAPMRGRIVPSRSKRALSFDDGQDYVPTTPDMAADAAPYVGDFGLCSRIAGDEEHFHCVALHNGAIVSIPQKPAVGTKS